MCSREQAGSRANEKLASFSLLSVPGLTFSVGVCESHLLASNTYFSRPGLLEVRKWAAAGKRGLASRVSLIIVNGALTKALLEVVRVLKICTVFI